MALSILSLIPLFASSSWPPRATQAAANPTQTPPPPGRCARTSRCTVQYTSKKTPHPKRPNPSTARTGGIFLFLSPCSNVVPSSPEPSLPLPYIPVSAVARAVPTRHADPLLSVANIAMHVACPAPASRAQPRPGERRGGGGCPALARCLPPGGPDGRGAGAGSSRRAALYLFFFHPP
jgi:hypothetical protein